jgi:dihydrodipicolinate synthase/N-acetylneuraminate lyase
MYHIPAVTGNPFSVATVERLSLHPNVVGIKDSGGDFVRFLQLQRNLDSDEFAVFQGVAALVGPSLLAGCRNSMCTVTSLLPQPEMELREAIASADLARVQILMHQISAVTELFRVGSCPLPVNFKAIAELLGLGPGQPHDPALQPDSDHIAVLAQGLAELGIRPDVVSQ